jgi:hypothetical protein
MEALVAARLETKYLIARDAAAGLREQLAARLTPHHHSVPPGFGLEAAPTHVTTTTYLDTARRVLYRAAISLPVHLKLRARQYRDEPARAGIESPVFIELKERDGVHSSKRRVALTTAEAAQLFAALALPDPGATRQACEALARASSDPSRHAVLRDLADTRLALGAALEASCVVRYRRDALHDAQGALRVTLDRDIEVFRAQRVPFDDPGPALFREPACVVEAKSAGPLPSWLQELFAAHGALAAAEYSKLVMASRAVHGPL